jgi:hypothetical protein
MSKLFEKRCCWWRQSTNQCHHQQLTKYKYKNTNVHYGQGQSKGQDLKTKKICTTDSNEWLQWLNYVKQFHLKNSFVNPIFSKKPNDTRPYLNIFVENIKILALVDSGANNCILGSSGFSLLQKLNLQIHYDTILNVSTADGQIQDYLGYIKVPIKLNNICHTVKVLVIPSVIHELILGIDFLKLFKIKADFENLT